MLQQLPLNSRSSRIADFTVWRFLLFVFLFSAILNCAPIHAASNINKERRAEHMQDISLSLVEYLKQEKTNSLHLIETIIKQALPTNIAEWILFEKQALSMITVSSAKIESLNGFIENQTKLKNSLNQRLKYLQQLPSTQTEMKIEDQVARIEAELVVNSTSIELIRENLELTRQYQALLNDELSKLKLWKANYELQQKLAHIKAQKHQLLIDLSHLYQHNLLAPQNKKNNDPILQEANILLNNQKISLIHRKLDLLNLQKNTVRGDILILNTLDTKTLPSVIDIYKEAINQCNAINTDTDSIISSLKNKMPLLQSLHLTNAVNLLLRSASSLREDTNTQKTNLLMGLDSYQNQLKKLVSSRQALSEYNKENLPLIIEKLIAIPDLFFKYIKTLSLKVYDSYTWLSGPAVAVMWLSLFGLFIISFLLNRLLKKLTSDKERSRLTGYLYDGILIVIQRNIRYLCLFGMIWLALYCTNISYSNYQLLFNLFAVWLSFRVLILIARLALFERVSDSSGKDVTLYYRLKWLLLFGGWTAAFMAFSHSYPLNLLLQDLFNRLFMVFILAISIVTWKSKDVIPHLLRPMLKAKKRYLKKAISLLVFLIPITLFTTGLIGLFGYVNLAWTLSFYQADALLIIVGYILVRGLVLDALDFISEIMISSLKNGWLWIEVFLKPLEKILRIIFVLTGVIILFQIYGWNSDSYIVTHLTEIAHYPIINIPGIRITLASIIAFTLLVALFIWASKWTKEFCFRWLYASTKDVGVRNSLSIFTQYAVIVLGSFVTLHVLGLDFSGMSMILGGLAVGMGFGLRDFASNIIGGLILLIERPVREGDFVTIGDHEGRVAHIGIRTMRVSSWDNMEVLVPNSETFNKSFTNWTHQDSIVRTVVPIKVSRADDPVNVQQLLLDVLAIVPEIVADPPAQVFLKRIDETLIEFEIRYFIDVHIHNRVEIRSKVLFAITAQFKAAGIKPPVEQMAIEFNKKRPIDGKPT